MSEGAGELARLSDVQVRYADGTCALDGLSLSVHASELVAVVGDNGSGKSTLLSVLAARLRPTTGTCVVQAAASELATQRTELDPEMTGDEHLALFAALHKIRPDLAKERIAALSRALALEELRPRLVEDYSGGMRRRLHIALSMLSDPELLLLDEPWGELDPRGRAALWELLHGRRARGGAQIVVSHDLEDLANHATRLVVLGRGRMLADAPPRELAHAHGGSLLAAYTSLTGAPPRPGRSAGGAGAPSGSGRGGRRG